jgi:hypothetical protein
MFQWNRYSRNGRRVVQSANRNAPDLPDSACFKNYVLSVISPYLPKETYRYTIKQSAVVDVADSIRTRLCFQVREFPGVLYFRKEGKLRSRFLRVQDFLL